MKNIVFVVSGLGLGGSELSLIKFIDSLELSDTRIHLISINRIDERVRKLINQKKLNIHTCTKGKLSLRILKLYKLVILVLNLSPVHLFAWGFVPIKQIARLKVFYPKPTYVASIRDSVVNEFTLSKRRRFSEKILNSYDKVIFNSLENSKDAIRSGLIASKSSVLFNTMKVDMYRDAMNFNSIGRKRNDASLRLLFVGRIEYQKGVDIIWQSLPLINENVKWTLSVVGEGSLLKQFIEEVDRAGFKEKVFFDGVKYNVGDYYKNHDVLLFPSRHEGYPNVLMEAMSYGIPVISSQCKTGPAELLEEGKFGVCIKDLSHKLLAKSIENVYDSYSDYAMKAKDGRAKVILKHSPKSIKLSYNTFFGNL